MRGNRQRLAPGRRISDELDVAPALRDDARSEVAKNADDFVAG
jgi:hypothetical protein